MALPDTTINRLATAGTRAYLNSVNVTTLGCIPAAHPKVIGTPTPTKACSQVLLQAVQ